ncbi:proline-rich protein 35 [Ascaphus truei]|uniref:proline-rich protein 35 n=1 Tax=Ascaphus truei TaxID=8439 RepID=UPI003F5A22DF
MSKEEEGGCKLSSACKHKERKPKKPHYIPRPWGKPYNYKCFQCPFTCMEKSHLYNHMKYSLCKNSLSLLIESDGLYKSSNFLIPEMHLLQDPPQDSGVDWQEACDSTGPNTRRGRQGEEKGPSDMVRFPDEGEEGEEEDEEAVGRCQKEGRGFSSRQASPSKSEAIGILAGLKGKRERPGKEGEPEFIITDVFSLERQCDKESEEQRFGKISRKPTEHTGGAGAEQWKLLTSAQKKGGAEVPVGCEGANTIPCYPPPTYTDYQEHQGLSLLGINYPLNTNLFSYLSPTMASGTAQLPFLASMAQLMHPAHSSHFQALQNTERSSFLPRFYYPLLFEQAFNTAESKIAQGKPVNQAQPGPTSFTATPKAKMPTETLKSCLHRAPEAKSAVSWGFGDNGPKQTLSHDKLTQERMGKWPPQAMRGVNQHLKLIPGCYGAPTSSMNEGSIPQKRVGDGSIWADARPAGCMKRKPCLERDKSEAVMDQTSSLVEGERSFQCSSCSPPLASPEPWCEKTPIPEAAAGKRRRGSEPTADNTAPMGDTSLLIGDLSRTLEEYGRVEKRLVNLASGDNSRQNALGEQLGKIRMELLHIHHALEKASCPHEGPLDLSIKRAEDMGKVGAVETPSEEDPVPLPLSKCQPKQLVKVELLPPELASCYARPTKCEADSSVPLCPEGRGGSAGLAQPQVSAQEERVGVGFERGGQQVESV